jgi:aryl-alcohol dehydrogenase
MELDGTTASRFRADAMREIRAAVVREKDGPFIIEPAFVAPPGPQEVLVRVMAAGLCHTDVKVRGAGHPAPVPIVLGHEGAGIVEEVGSEVRDLSPGDRVAMSFLSCGDCSPCWKGAVAYCAHFFPLNFGGARLDGSHALRDAAGESLHDRFFGQSSFASHAIAHARNVVRVPDDLPFDVLAPLGCGIQTGAGAVLNVFRLGPGASFACFGAGAVGLSAIMAARATGAAKIIAVDVVPSRLALARELGATHGVNAAEVDAVGAVREITGGGADFTLESSGRPTVLAQAVDCLGPLGTCGIIGGAPRGSQLALDIMATMGGGRTIRGIIEGDSRPHEFIPQLVDLYRAGRFPFDRLITRYPFERINDAMHDSETGKAIKPVLVMEGP